MLQCYDQSGQGPEFNAIHSDSEDDYCTVTHVNNSPIQDYNHLDDHAPPTYEMTPGLKPFTRVPLLNVFNNFVNIRLHSWSYTCPFFCRIRPFTSLRIKYCMFECFSLR